MLSDCTTLDQLWDEVHKLPRQHYPTHTLKSILGNGKISKPKVMFVFINPTARNISSDPSWKKPRFPFIGTKQIWRIFHQAGLFEDWLLGSINASTTWSLEFTEKVRRFLEQQEFYFTNIVKWTGKDATLPDAEKIKLFLPILEREIEIVQLNILLLLD